MTRPKTTKAPDEIWASFDRHGHPSAMFVNACAHKEFASSTRYIRATPARRSTSVERLYKLAAKCAVTKASHYDLDDVLDNPRNYLDIEVIGAKILLARRATLNPDRKLRSKS